MVVSGSANEGQAARAYLGRGHLQSMLHSLDSFIKPLFHMAGTRSGFGTPNENTLTPRPNQQDGTHNQAAFGTTVYSVPAMQYETPSVGGQCSERHYVM